MRKRSRVWLVPALVLAGACALEESADKDDGAGGTAGATGGTTTGGAAGSTSGGSGGSGKGGSGGSGGSTTGGSGGSKSAGGSAGSMSSGGSGESGESGGPGTAGEGGGGSEGMGDSCALPESPSNDTQDDSTEYTLGTDYEGCLQMSDDIDYYELTSPDVPGYVTVSVTDVGPDGNTVLTLWSAADEGEIYHTNAPGDGDNAYVYFLAKPGASFRISVEPYSSSIVGPNPYLLNATFHEIDDPYEPNNLRTQAKPIEVGEPVDAFIFAGWENSTGIPSGDWHDWYSIDLAAGQTRYLLSIVAPETNSVITLFDDLGTELDHHNETTTGSSNVWDLEITDAGSYFVRVMPYSSPTTRGDTVTVPQYFELPYTLTVTQ
jgi:hypothetical protein